MIVVDDFQGLVGQVVHLLETEEPRNSSAPKIGEQISTYMHEQANDIVQVGEGGAGVRVKVQILLNLVLLDRVYFVYEGANHLRNLAYFVVQGQSAEIGRNVSRFGQISQVAGAEPYLT